MHNGYAPHGAMFLFPKCLTAGGWQATTAGSTAGPFGLLRSRRGTGPRRATHAAAWFSRRRGWTFARDFTGAAEAPNLANLDFHRAGPDGQRQEGTTQSGVEQGHSWAMGYPLSEGPLLPSVNEGVSAARGQKGGIG